MKLHLESLQSQPPALLLGPLVSVWKLFLISLMETLVNILHLVGWLYWTRFPSDLKEKLKQWF